MLNTSFNFFEESDINKLRKYLIAKENEWKKDRAVLEQKNQLLELQLEDLKLRECNQRKLNDTINQAINESAATQKKAIVEFQKTMDCQQKEQNKAKYREQLKTLENQLRNLQEQLSEKENHIKEAELQCQKQYFQFDHRIQSLESEKQQLLIENAKIKEQILKVEESNKTKEQQQKYVQEQELQRLKDLQMQDNLTKQQDYELRFSQLSQLFEKEKEQLNQRLSKCQNTIKRYQQHIEQNVDIINIKQQYEEQIKQLKEKNAELQAQFQYERQVHLKQIEELKKVKEHESTSKKRSVDAIKLKSSLHSYDSPVQCKSFHIQESKTGQLKNSQTQSIILNYKMTQQAANQSFERKQNEALPISFDQFNLMKNKKQKSQSTLSIPTSNNYNLNSYLQEGSNQESFQLDSNNNKEDVYKMRVLKQLNPNITNRQLQFDYNRSVKHDPNHLPEQFQRSISQEQLKQSTTNLSKILGQTDLNQRSGIKVPAFTQHQLNTLKNCPQNMYPCTTLRMNENHVQKIRYNNNHSTHEEGKQNKENQPRKGDIKLLIGKLLKGKVGEENQHQFAKNNRF